jgi:uncharacterized iron-regulated membrane protein
MARRILFWLHRWIGLVLAVYVVSAGVTGAALVFREELFRMLYMPAEAITATSPRVGIDEISAQIRKQFPEWHLHTIHWPNERTPYWFAEIKKGEVGVVGEAAHALYLDPRDASLRYDHNYGKGPLRWLQLLHFNLLAGREGRVWNAMGALLVVFLSLSGILLWWPRLKSSPFLLRFSPRVGARRFLWELHQLTGLYALAFLLLASLTGAYFGWRATVHAAIASVLPMRFMNQALEPVKAPVRGELLPLSRFEEETRRLFPHHPPFRVLLPERPQQPLRMVVYHGNADEFYKASNLFFDPYSGHQMRVDRFEDRETGDSAVTWIGVLHLGAFGGTPVKLLWMAGGLTFPVLAITGLLLFFRKIPGQS